MEEKVLNWGDFIAAQLIGPLPALSSMQFIISNSNKKKYIQNDKDE